MPRMNNIYSFFTKEWAELNRIRSGEGLPFWFLRILQVLCLASCLMAIITLGSLDLMPSMTQDWSGTKNVGTSLIGTIILATLFKLVAAEAAIRLLRQGKITGWWIGMTLSLMAFAAIGTWVLAIGGLYAMLNPKSQQAYLSSAPEWLTDLLTLLKINHIQN
jgi:hypothetical protein